METELIDNKLLAKQIGLNIAFYRNYFNISQKELSDLSGIRQATISNIENNVSDFYFETLKSLTEALNIPLGLVITISELDLVIRNKNTSLVKKLEFKNYRNQYEILIENNRNRKLSPISNIKEESSKQITTILAEEFHTF
jgi:transcriptional regulator with XRE-family HTH domain